MSVRQRTDRFGMRAHNQHNNGSPAIREGRNARPSMLAVEQPHADEMADMLEVLPAQFEEINPPAK